MQEKRTKENNREPGGLNDGNPNTDSTPIDPVKLPNLTGGTTQHNYEDEVRGDAEKDQPDENFSDKKNQ